MEVVILILLLRYHPNLVRVLFPGPKFRASKSQKASSFLALTTWVTEFG